METQYESQVDQSVRREYYGQIRRANRGGGRHTCPTCKTPGALSQWEKNQGYQCSNCTKAAEGCGFGEF